MIPGKLTIKNFLSYGPEPQEINFSEHDLVCFIGRNGHGKSSVLDAITWVLWGQARKNSGATKADEGLLHSGQKNMLVHLDFQFGGKQYRVRREYTKTFGKPVHVLDFEVMDDKGSYGSLTDKTIKATQEKIETTLGIDYETFVNTSFLRQGNADEFSRKSPKERKQILTRILGLSYYEALAQKAADKGKIANSKIAEFEAVCVSMDRELGAAGETEKLFIEAAKSRATLEKKIKTVSTSNKKFEEQRAVLVRDREIVEKEIAAAPKDTIVAARRDELSLTFREWRNVHRQFVKSPSIDLLIVERKKCAETEVGMRKAQAKIFKLREEGLAVKEKLQARTAEREKLFAKLMSEKKLAVKEHALELEALNKKRNELKIKLTDSNKNLEKLEGELRGCGALEKKQKDLLAGLEIFRKQFDKRREFYHWIVQQGNTLKNSSSALVHKTRAVNCDQGPTCPLCEQVLTARRKIFLGDKFSKEEYFLLHRLRRVTKIMPRLKKILIEQHKELEVQMAELEKTKLALLRVQDLEKKKSEETKNKTSIELELKKIVASEISLLKSNAASTKDIDDLILPAKKEAWLKEDEQLKAINIKFATLVKEIKTIDYNKNQHDATVEQLKQLESQCAIAKDTSAAKAEQMRRKNEILRLCEELKKSKASGLASKKAEEKIKKHNAEITKLDSEIETSSKNLAAVRSELEKVLQEVGRLDGMRTRLVALGKELKERRAEQSKEREELEGYEILSQAYGKNGIQALLIDSAIPEIENEANTILARLTGNRAQIFIESLRGLKKGGVKETLDIKISDSAGMRQYEMFSGGEAFRIDFSLRIAISKLLARRAGTALQTLVIDEGFGSQDEDGILQLTEALYSIRGDFEKVIIVSHLESMKEAFPTHFIVEKGPLGSVVRIEQRG